MTRFIEWPDRYETVETLNRRQRLMNWSLRALPLELSVWLVGRGPFRIVLTHAQDEELAAMIRSLQ